MKAASGFRVIRPTVAGRPLRRRVRQGPQPQGQALHEPELKVTGKGQARLPQRGSISLRGTGIGRAGIKYEAAVTSPCWSLPSPTGKMGTGPLEMMSASACNHEALVSKPVISAAVMQNGRPHVVEAGPRVNERTTEIRCSTRYTAHMERRAWIRCQLAKIHVYGYLSDCGSAMHASEEDRDVAQERSRPRPRSKE